MTVFFSYQADDPTQFKKVQLNITLRGKLTQNKLSTSISRPSVTTMYTI